MSRATTSRSPLSFSSLGRGPWATFLWGSPRPVLNRVLYAMVRANDATPFWLDIRGPEDTSSEPGPVELGWIPEERLFLTREPADARPQDTLANLALLNVVRSDEPETVLARLSDFLRLPPIAQEVVSQLGLSKGQHAVAIANSDRVRGDYPRTPEGVRPVIEAFLAGQVAPFFSAMPPPGQGRWAFDFVFELRCGDLAHWREGVLIAEKARPESGFQVGRAVPLDSFPEVIQVFRA